MENVAGEALVSYWLPLDTAAKLTISDQLRSHLTQLRTFLGLWLAGEAAAQRLGDLGR